MTEYNRMKEYEFEHNKQKTDNDQSWKQKYSTANDLLPHEWEPSEFVTRNTESLHVMAGGFFVGPWLRGRIFKHCNVVWEVKSAPPFEAPCITHDTEQKAKHQLLQANSRNPWSINRWQIHLDEDDIKDNTHSIKIMLSEGRYFLVSDDDDVLHALSNYEWCDETINYDPSVHNYRAINVNKRSKWQNAQDLVSFNE